MRAHSVPPPPRLIGGAIASVVFHGGLVAAFVFLRPPAPPPLPPIYRVQLIAAPAGERAIGVVQTPPATPPPVEAAQPVTKTVPPRPKVATPKARSRRAPKPATATAPPKPPKETPKSEPQPTAGGGPTGGTGADVANIDTNGLEFPYPWYTTNVVSRILRQFHPTSARWTAEVRFVIQRDGTVDPSSIKIVTSSGNYPFDTQALGAIESASRNRAFGALPPGFREDILPVTFRFSPASSK